LYEHHIITGINPKTETSLATCTTDNQQHIVVVSGFKKKKLAWDHYILGIITLFPWYATMARR
jgi:hypothetical protein